MFFFLVWDNVQNETDVVNVLECNEKLLKGSGIFFSGVVEL